ncbi:DUF305 domain-containing protein [Bosea sp. R86505]|uniref:DUF305 domain-containing protein n=1 Tax=Bosea sp. R86505 TaxID=3101710 RepID=UPI00366C08FD
MGRRLDEGIQARRHRHEDEARHGPPLRRQRRRRLPHQQRVPHHQGAVDMTKVVLAHANDETSETLAAEIIKDHEREITQMRHWPSKDVPK